MGLKERLHPLFSFAAKIGARIEATADEYNQQQRRERVQQAMVYHFCVLAISAGVDRVTGGMLTRYYNAKGDESSPRSLKYIVTGNHSRFERGRGKQGNPITVITLGADEYSVLDKS